MAGPFNGHGIEIDLGIEKEQLYGDPYVQLLLKHLRDPHLFEGTPADSRKRQQELLRPFLDFFLRHDRENFYHNLLKRKGLLDESASEARIKEDIELEDLVKLRTYSDDLRGQGQHKRLIGEIDPYRLPPGSQTHYSSGTTQNSSGPVTIIRSPLTLQMIRLVNSGLVAWSIGGPKSNSYCMLQMTPEMTDFMAFPAFSADALRHLGSDIIFGNQLDDNIEEKIIWRRLKPDRTNMKSFFSAKRAPKYMITGSTGLFNTVANPSRLKRLAIQMTMGIPPIDLGEGGVLMTGGGLKRVPAVYETMRDFIVAMTPYIRAKKNGVTGPAPVMDVLGMTESASVFLNRAVDPHDDAAWVKYPHPLTFVTLLDSGGDFRPVSGDELRNPKLFFYVNMACIDYLEAIVSGDFVTHVPSTSCPQHGFIYDHRAGAAEGFQVREGCG